MVGGFWAVYGVRIDAFWSWGPFVFLESFLLLLSSSGTPSTEAEALPRDSNIP